MIVGVLKEIKQGENRVALRPAGAEVLAENGHTVLVQNDAGAKSGFANEVYESAGAVIEASASEIYKLADMILRVKEPQPQEIHLLRENQIYFSYLHLAASKDLTRGLLDTGAVCIGYETIQKPDGSLPLLKPMSEVAGPMAVQEGAKNLEMAQGGHGILLGGVPGVDPGTVLILGGGAVGATAARMAAGLGAKAYVLDINLERLRYLSDVMPDNCIPLASNPANIRELIQKADLVVGAPLIPGSRTPVLVTREMLQTMKPGAVLVDVAIDQGGCFETSTETTHDRPTYVFDGIVHYAVSNMPGALPKTGTMALTNATLPYALLLAGKGWRQAALEHPDIRAGINTIQGRVTCPAVARALDMECALVEDLV